MTEKPRQQIATWVVKRDDLLSAKRKAEKRYDDHMKACKHWETKYHPRQIAEDDPWTECLYCGKVLA